MPEKPDGAGTLAQFSLTPAETRLALAIAEGKSLSALAEQNDVSLHTVRNQLKSVFAKTGVSRQLDLALLVHKLRG